MNCCAISRCIEQFTRTRSHAVISVRIGSKGNTSRVKGLPLAMDTCRGIISMRHPLIASINNSVVNQLDGGSDWSASFVSISWRQSATFNWSHLVPHSAIHWLFQRATIRAGRTNKMANLWRCVMHCQVWCVVPSLDSLRYCFISLCTANRSCDVRGRAKRFDIQVSKEVLLLPL